MKAFVEGNLRIVENSTFKDAKTGSDVPYFTNYIQDEGGQMIKIGSKDNHTDMVGRDCVFVVQIREDFEHKKLFRLKLLDVKPQNN